MIFVDTNVLIDILNPDQQWFDWSRDRIAQLGREHSFAVNAVVVAELASNFTTVGELKATLWRWDIEVLPLDEQVAFAAGQAFRSYRRTHKIRDALLADFLIGGHALQVGIPLLTRDAAIYRRYFPDLPLITPEIHP